MTLALAPAAALVLGVLAAQAPAAVAPPAGMAAAAAESCPPGPPSLPPALAGWASRAPLAAAASPAAAGSASLALGRGVDAALRPSAEVAFAAAPGRPVRPGERAGLLALPVPAAGTYAVGLSSAAWIDVVDAAGAAVASTAHGHGPPCSGVRKTVDFPLSPGRYTIQLTTAEPSVGVIAFRR